MDLSELTAFQDKKRKEFEEAVSCEAKKLSFEDIIKEIHFEVWPFVNGSWEDGQKLEFFSYQGYTVIVDRETFILKGKYDIELTNFTGEKVREYYEFLSTKILNAKQEQLDNLPF